MTGKHVARRDGDLEPARKRPKRHVENDEAAAAIIRQLYAFARRMADDPAAMVYMREIDEASSNAFNLAVFAAHQKTDSPYSYRELAAILGVTAPAMLKRKRRGEEIFTRLMALASAPVVRVADLRAARALQLAEADVEDRTGTRRELAAGGEAD